MPPFTPVDEGHPDGANDRNHNGPACQDAAGMAVMGMLLQQAIHGLRNEWARFASCSLPGCRGRIDYKQIWELASDALIEGNAVDVASGTVIDEYGR
jgi:hypothetical protein